MLQWASKTTLCSRGLKLGAATVMFSAPLTLKLMGKFEEILRMNKEGIGTTCICKFFIFV